MSTLYTIQKFTILFIGLVLWFGESVESWKFKIKKILFRLLKPQHKTVLHPSIVQLMWNKTLKRESLDAPLM